MAEILNIQRATYGEYERGNNLPPIDKLMIIAETLGVSIDYLVGKADQEVIDVHHRIKKVLSNLENKTNNVIYNGKALNSITTKMIACTLENTIKAISILEGN